ETHGSRRARRLGEADVLPRLMLAHVIGVPEDARQERAPELTRIADALGDSGLKQRPRRAEARGQAYRAVDLQRTKLSGQAMASLAPGVSAARVLGDDPVHLREDPVQLRHPGPREDEELRLRKRRAEGSDRGERHDDVADPVRRAHENLHLAIIGSWARP